MAVQLFQVKAKKERRHRRRNEKKRLKTIAEEAFGSGSQFFTKEAFVKEATHEKYQSKTPDDDYASNRTEEDRKMWRRLLKNSRSPSESARLRRAWRLWQSTMDTSQDDTASSSSSFTTEKKRASTSSSSTPDDEWFAAWEANSNFNADYESFWTYGSNSADDARRQAFAWQQKQRQQAGNTHQFFKSSSSSSQRTVFTLSKEIRSSLSTLSLATTHLPSAVELKSAFRASAMAWHPDRHLSNPAAVVQAEEKFKQIQAAFAYLQTMVVA